jgi:hypothetical protein
MNKTIVAASAGLALFGGVLGCSGSASESSSASGAAVSSETRRVDFPSKSGVAAPDAKTGKTVQYYGGSVIPNPKVYVVWWGDPSKLTSALTATKGGIADFFAGITNSKYIDWMNEYDTNLVAQVGSHKGDAGTNQLIGRGNYAGTLTLAKVPTGDVTDAQIQTTLDAAFTANTLPQPDENTVYAIFFPSSVSISIGGDESCATFGAYHEATTETTRHAAYYLVVPDCGTSFSEYTNVTSHELIEATTDAFPTPGSSPDYPQAWNDTSGNEVADLCESSSGSIVTPTGTFTVQGIWDETTQKCVTTRTYKADYSVSFATPTLATTPGKSSTVTLSTATTAGSAQPLALSVTAPAGVTAQLSAPTVTSGKSVTLTITAASAAASAQVVVRADGTTGSATQTHTAALLLN